MLGWGPGSASWTTAEHLRPIPGLHPPDQVVADLHSLPLQLGYELGWSGLLLTGGLALVFLRRRGAAAADPRLRRFALLGLAALAGGVHRLPRQISIIQWKPGSTKSFRFWRKETVLRQKLSLIGVWRSYMVA